MDENIRLFFDRPVTTFKSYLKKKKKRGASEFKKKILSENLRLERNAKPLPMGCAGKLQKTAAGQTEVQKSLLCNRTQMSVI